MAVILTPFYKKLAIFTLTMVFENWRLNVTIGLPKVLTDVANDILISRDFFFFTSKIIQNPRQSKDGSFLANQLTCCYKSRVLL